MIRETMPTEEAKREINMKKELIKQQAKFGKTNEEEVTSERTMLYVCNLKQRFENSNVSCGAGLRHFISSSHSFCSDL